MCKKCDGYSWEEIERANGLAIMINGYYIQQVVDPQNKVWSYTTGLLESFNHPELICFDLDADVQNRTVFQLAEQVKHTGEIDELTIEIGQVELIPVHRSHLATDLVAQWTNRYERIAERGEFLQIVPDQLQLCPNHGPQIRLFDQKVIRRRKMASRDDLQKWLRRHKLFATTYS
ncbi:MAG: DUF4262 domain-containing protein [Actinobacteria bacterium]|nr:DUF4262 domain-containing protein [Actinomycetota bacterium]